jgi:hypothetical protein
MACGLTGAAVWLMVGAMVDKDTHIVSRFVGIPKAGCRDVDHAD